MSVSGKTNLLLTSLILAGAGLVPFQPANAFVHLWEISQVYSNDDGSEQFIELFVTSDGEGFTQGAQVVTRRDGGQEQTYTIPENVASDTANRHLLLATGTIAGVEPDFVIPQNFVPIDFQETGTVDISGFAFAGDPNIVTYTSIPADGFRSLDGHGSIQDPATVTNFNGDTATLEAPDDGPPEVPAITEVSFSGDTFTLSFTTESERSYTVQYVDTLTDGNWVALEPALAGTGEIETVSDSNPDSPRRFYRVVAE